MPFFDDLVEATAGPRAEFLHIPAVHLGLQGRVGLDTYLAFLAQAYHHVSHTVPLLMACGARLPADKEWLRTAIAGYITEELGHEHWILEDIINAGGDAESVRAGHPHVTTELMLAYAWDTVQRRNPVGLFGMVYVLEGSSVALATHAAAAMQKSLGLPDRAFTYLTSHGQLDQQHMQHFALLMNRLDDAADRSAVLHAAGVFYRLYGGIFQSLPVPRHDTIERNAA